MKEMTVTMTMGDYEIMKNQIETLRKRDIRNYVSSEYKDVYVNEKTHVLRLSDILQDLESDYPISEVRGFSVNK